MTDFVMRCQTAQALDHPASWIQRAAFRFFVKERQRERERLGREIRGGHLVLEEHCDDRLAILEDEQYIELLLECLTSTQRKAPPRLQGKTARPKASASGCIQPTATSPPTCAENTIPNVEWIWLT